MAMRKMSNTVQSIMNIYSRKHTMDGPRIDLKMAELRKEWEAAKKLPAVTGYDEEIKNYQSFLSTVESFIKASIRLKTMMRCQMPMSMGYP